MEIANKHKTAYVKNNTYYEVESSGVTGYNEVPPEIASAIGLPRFRLRAISSASPSFLHLHPFYMSISSAFPSPLHFHTLCISISSASTSLLHLHLLCIPISSASPSPFSCASQSPFSPASPSLSPMHLHPHLFCISISLHLHPHLLCISISSAYPYPLHIHILCISISSAAPSPLHLLLYIFISSASSSPFSLNRHLLCIFISIFVSLFLLLPYICGAHLENTHMTRRMHMGNHWGVQPQVEYFKGALSTLLLVCQSNGVQWDSLCLERALPFSFLP